jgi:hypothetical protein
MQFRRNGAHAPHALSCVLCSDLLLVTAHMPAQDRRTAGNADLDMGAPEAGIVGKFRNNIASQHFIGAHRLPLGLICLAF